MTSTGGGPAPVGPPVPISPRRVAIVGVAVAVLAVLGQFLHTRDTPSGPVQLTTAIAIGFTVMGTMILVAVPGHAVGRLMAAAGALAAVNLVAASWSTWTTLAWLSQWTWWPPYGLIFLSLLVFPDGRLPSRRWLPLAILLAVGTAVPTVALAVAAIRHPFTLLVDTSAAISQFAERLIFVAFGGVALTALCLVAVVISLVVRWRRASGDVRRQIACLLPAVVILVLGLVLDPLGITGAGVIAAVAVPSGMTVAVLRFRLYNLDTLINRTIVWLIMTVLVVVAFIATVFLVDNVIVTVTGSNSYQSLVAAGLVAVTFEPARRRVQRFVDRLLYGERDDPYKVIARLGDLVGRTPEPNAVLPALTQTIAESLNVPYVGVEVDAADGSVTILAEYGRRTAAVEAFDMVAQGATVGRLTAARRSPGSGFTSRESRLLSDLAIQAAVAVETARLIRDLQASRERIVMAREEERLRLRRDLHDGLGPTFAGMSMQLRTVRREAAGRDAATEIIDNLAQDLVTCQLEVRRLVDELRPASLDNGLEAAIRTECRRFHSGSLSVDVCVSGDLADLPAATEVVAYRIVSEALTNVARHSQAHTCGVTVDRADHLTIEVTDDGVGLGSARTVGVGMRSMRERSAEIGGECTFESAAPNGTTVRVRLPALRATRSRVPGPRRETSTTPEAASTPYPNSPEAKDDRS
jgi:two-component system, NarL family, sensor kinase